MAQDGDTITYTYSDGTSVSEDVSAVSLMKIEYLEGGSGGLDYDGGNAGKGGLVENVIVDLSGIDTIYLWVGEGGGDSDNGNESGGKGRYDGGTADPNSGGGGASTEVSLLNTDASDSADEPFIAAAGGGGGNSASTDSDGAGGARGRTGPQGDAEGTAPPLGGAGGTDGAFGGDAEGAVDGGTTATIVDSGTTFTGRGPTYGGNGEIQITYSSPVQDGDTVTYTYSDGSVVIEDISEVNQVTVDYLNGAGGFEYSGDGGAGGRVEDTVVDVSNYDRLYLWVGSQSQGRYEGEVTNGGAGGGSTEIAFVNTDASDSEDEPFIVGAGGGGGGGEYSAALQ